MEIDGHRAPISGIAAFGNARIVTAGYDNQLILWDDEFTILAKARHEHLVNQADFSPCGKFVASASSDYSVRVWSAIDLQQQMLFKHHIDDVEMVKFSPSGKFLASCSRDNTIAIFDLNMQMLCGELFGHSADVLSIDWIDDYTLISSGDDGSVRYWDVERQEEMSKMNFDGMETDTLVVLSKSLVAVGNDDGKINILENGQVVQVLDAHDSGVKRLSYNKTSNSLLSVSYDRKMSCWQLQGSSIDFISETDIPSHVWPRSCCFIDEVRIAFATFTSHYSIFNRQTGEWLDSNYQWSQSVNGIFMHGTDFYKVGDSGTLFKNDEQLVSVNSLCNFVVVRPREGSVNEAYFGGQEGAIWRFDEENRATELIYQHIAPVNVGLIYQDRLLVLADYNGQIVLFDLATLTAKIVKVFEHATKSICIDGPKVFAVSADCKAAFVNMESLEVNMLGVVHDKIANDCVADHGRYYSVSRDRKVRRFGDQLELEIESPHTHSIKCISISDDGNTLATGSYGGEIALYDSGGDSIKLIKLEKPTTWGISCLLYNKQENAFLGSSYDSNIYKVGL